MSDLRTAALRALEALKLAHLDLFDWQLSKGSRESWSQAQVNEAITSLKAALRQAAPIIQPEIKADKEPRLLPWKGLTEEEHTYYKACGFVGVKAVEEKLRARNSTLACHQGEEGK